MKAIVCTRNGPAAVLWLTEVPRPEPREDQVLVKVQAAFANALDYRRFEGVSLETHPGSTARRSGNKVLGADIAGRVETVGAAVAQFQSGDKVFGVTAGSAGGFAEYACAAEDNLALKPATGLPGLALWGRMQSEPRSVARGRNRDKLQTGRGRRRRAPRGPRIARGGGTDRRVRRGRASQLGRRAR